MANANGVDVAYCSKKLEIEAAGFSFRETPLIVDVTEQTVSTAVLHYQIYVVVIFDFLMALLNRIKIHHRAE